MNLSQPPTRTPDSDAATVLELSWTLFDAHNQVISEQTEPAAYLLGSADLLPALSQHLQDKQVGETLEVQLEPELAFGAYDEMLVLLEPRSAFPPAIEVGMVFEQLPAGCNTPKRPADFYVITELYPEHVVLDGNHPLAGIALRVRAKVHARRAARMAETIAGTAGASDALGALFTVQDRAS